MTTVGTIQTRLEKALQRASQSDDRELAGRIRDEGHRLVFLLNGLLRSSRMYSIDNTALETPAQEFAVALKGLMDLLGAVHVVCVEDQVYVNDVRLRVRPTEQPVVDHLAAEMGRHDVGGLSFHQPPDAAAVKALAVIVGGPAGTDRPRQALAARLAPVLDVELSGKWRFRLHGDATARKADFREARRRAGPVLQEALANLAAGRLPNPLPVRRAVIDLVDGLRDDASPAAAAPLRRRAQAQGEEHQLSVCGLALLLGRAVGLPEAALSDLGVAAMLHDVGYLRGADRERHPAAGARLLLRQRGFHEAKVRRLLAVLEHHLPYMPAGPDAGEPPSLFARILRIAEDYDLLVSARPGQAPLPPPAALAAMWAGRGPEYDAILIALFVQAMGLYPPGTVLELSDGSWTLSVSGGRDHERFAWPVVAFVRGPDGRPRQQRQDLFETRAAIGPRRVVDPFREGFDVAAALDEAFGAG
jgi:hypothetical protein